MSSKLGQDCFQPASRPRAAWSTSQLLTRCGHEQSLERVFFVVDKVTTRILANTASRRRWQLCKPAGAPT
jgi:hypothetical protein